MASRVSGPAALLTPSLLAENRRLRAELVAVIERSRDLRWWAGQVRAGAVRSYRPAICGGAPDDDAAQVLAIITKVTLCQECVAHKSGLPTSRVDAILTTIAGAIALSVRTAPCVSCLETKTTYGFDGDATHLSTGETPRPNETRHAILNFLGKHPGIAFCADCIAAKLFGGKKNIDVALRHLEGNGMHRHNGRCSVCEKLRLAASLPSTN